VNPRTIGVISIAASAVTCWVIVLCSVLAYWSSHSKWRKRLKARDGLPGVWEFNLDMSRQYEIWRRQLGRDPDPEPQGEVERLRARRHIVRSLYFGGAFVGVLAIGAVVSTVWPR
jgi:hypothetical protein